jgi:hypothetical protein
MVSESRKYAARFASKKIKMPLPKLGGRTSLHEASAGKLANCFEESIPALSIEVAVGHQKGFVNEC